MTHISILGLEVCLLFFELIFKISSIRIASSHILIDYFLQHGCSSQCSFSSSLHFPFAECKVYHLDFHYRKHCLLGFPRMRLGKIDSMWRECSFEILSINVNSFRFLSALTSIISILLSCITGHEPSQFDEKL